MLNLYTQVLLFQRICLLLSNPCLRDFCKMPKCRKTMALSFYGKNPQLIKVIVHWDLEDIQRREREISPEKNAGEEEQRPTLYGRASKEGSKISVVLKIHLMRWNHKDGYPKCSSKEESHLILRLSHWGAQWQWGWTDVKDPGPVFCIPHSLLGYLERGEIQEWLMLNFPAAYQDGSSESDFIWVQEN